MPAVPPLSAQGPISQTSCCACNGQHGETPVTSPQGLCPTKKRRWQCQEGVASARLANLAVPKCWGGPEYCAGLLCPSHLSCHMTVILNFEDSSYSNIVLWHLKLWKAPESTICGILPQVSGSSPLDSANLGGDSSFHSVTLLLSGQQHSL